MPWKNYILCILMMVGLFNSRMTQGTEIGDYLESKRLRVYVESGALLGVENELPNYKESDFRFFTEAGIEKVRPISSIESLKSLGLGWSIAVGEYEVRQGIGPTVTWRLNDNWDFHSMVGIALSNPIDKFAPGFHTRNYVMYRDVASIEILFQTLPANEKYRNQGGNTVNSIYGGVVLHGKPGVYLTLGYAAALVIGSVIVAIALTGLSSLN